MTFLVTLSDFLSVVAGVAATFLAALFLVVTITRKSSLAWINILFIVVMLAAGSEMLSNFFAGEQSVSAAQLSMRMLVSIAMVACAIACIPLYRRVRKHPQYDEIQAANRQLEYTKRLFKTFLDETPFAAYVVDANDRFLFVNARMASDFGVSPEKMVGTTFENWFSQDTAAQFVVQTAAVRASRMRQELLVDVDLQATKATFLSTSFLLPGPGGEPLIGAVALEISEQLKSQAIDALLARIVELSPDAIYTFSNEHKLTSWNQAAEQILGYDSAEIIDRPLTILAPPEQVHLAESIWNLEQGEIIKDREFIHVAKDGTLKHLSLSCTKVKSFLGVGSNYAAIARDETETRLAAKRMQELNGDLDSRVALLSQANKELPLARDQALQALDLRSAFVANMSHAIRTPLSGILGAGELLLDNLEDSGAVDSLQTILQSAEALLAIVNEILDASKLQDDSVSLTSKPFNPSTLVNDCVKLIQPGAASKRLKVAVSIDPTIPELVLADQFKIRQVLLNLLGNAVKFANEGVITVEVTLLTETEDDATLQFSVVDNGIGISAEEIPSLFTPFSRIEKSTKGIRGSGLGLAISKRLVDVMQGKIDFESRKEGGAKFWFILDLKKVEARSAKSKYQRSPEAEPAKDLLSSSQVLLVEDNPVLSLLTIRQLAKLGIKADCAETGRLAIEKVRQNHFDVILMDVNLPDINGYEVTAVVRELEKHAHIIIAITAGAMRGDREKAIAAGMNDYLAKPVTPEQLRETLVRWLETAKGKRAGAAMKHGSSL